MNHPANVIEGNELNIESQLFQTDQTMKINVIYLANDKMSTES